MKKIKDKVVSANFAHSTQHSKNHFHDIRKMVENRKRTIKNPYKLENENSVAGDFTVTD